MLNQTKLKEILDYSQTTGVFVWKTKVNRRVRVGGKAGSYDKDGYVKIKIDKKDYRAHRLAWLYIHGCWPTDQIDHINRIKDDNRIENLRDVTQQQQQFNTKAKGYFWDKQRGKWQARIMVNIKMKYLGRYDTEEDARAAYLAAKEKLHNIGEQQ